MMSSLPVSMSNGQSIEHKPKQPVKGASGGQNRILQGMRVILAAAVIFSHLYTGMFGSGSRFLGWVSVNTFFVMSGWLAYISLDRAWCRLVTRQPPRDSRGDVSGRASSMAPVDLAPQAIFERYKKSSLPRYLTHVSEYHLRRLPPFIWIAALIVLAFKCTTTFHSRISIRDNIFSFHRSPIFNFWTIHLRSPDTGERVFWVNPPIWYISCLTLYTVLAPFAYHAIRALKSLKLRNKLLRVLVYAFLPFLLMGLDYLYVRSRLNRDLHHDSGPHPDMDVFAIQVSPEGYAGKFFIPMLACALWTELADALKPQDLRTASFERRAALLDYFPLVDCLIVVQILIWCHVPRIDRNVFWACVYISIFLPGNCLVCWAAMNEIGSPFILSRLLGSRWLFSVAPGFATLFLYLLHVPYTEVVNRRPRIHQGIVLGLFSLYHVCLSADWVHNQVMKEYNGFIGKLFRPRELPNTVEAGPDDR